MTEPEPDKSTSLDHLPEPLRAKVLAEAPQGVTVQVAAGYDLNARGRYAEGWLLLAGGQLADYVLRDGEWHGRWLAVRDFDEAHIVEGLGVHMLRLMKDGQRREEFRYTMRHAKTVAKLQRQMERQIAGKEPSDAPDAAPKPDEKKVRCEKCDRIIPPWAEYCPACMSRRRILSRLLDFVKPYKGRAIAGFTLAILTTAMSVARPYLTKPMMDDGLGMGPGRHANYATLMIYVAIFAALTLLTATFEGGWLRMMAGLGSRIARDLRVGVYGHLHRLSLSFFSRKPTGQLVTRVTSDTDRIWEFITFTLVEIAISLLTIVGVCTFLFVLNWRLACFVLVPIPIMVVLTFFFHGRLHTVIDRLVHRYGQMTAVISDALPGVRVVKAFGQERREVRRFGDKNDKYYDDDISCLTLWTLFGPLLQFCSQFGSLLIWTVGGYWVVRDLGKPNPAVTPGELLSFVGYMWMFYGPIHMLAHMDRALNRAASSVQRVLEILDTAPSIFSPTHARKLEQPRGEIELRDVSFSYDGIRRVLKNINLKIEAGKMIGLAGPSGGGKSTLINLICRFYDVLEGQILFDGTDVRDYDVESLRRRIGVVLQEPFLFFGTVGENIAYGSPEATMPQIIEAAKAANAHDFIVGFPDGYDTIVGERGHTLSGGERQRISIARAILGNPAVLILDEATSSVDTETEKLIQEAMDRLIAHRTTIAIAHRLSTLRKADRLVILENGAIAEEGSHEELAGKENGLYAKLLRTQTEMQSIIAIG